MKLENQVSNLELSKRLKELGVKQESQWRWVRLSGERTFHLSLWLNQDEFEKSGEYAGVGISSYSDVEVESADEWYSAFTVAELGEMLPTRVVKEPDDFYLMIWKNGQEDLWSVAYRTPKYRIALQEFDGKEADARAKMLIYLIENKLLPPSNNSLKK